MENEANFVKLLVGIIVIKQSFFRFLRRKNFTAQQTKLSSSFHKGLIVLDTNKETCKLYSGELSLVFQFLPGATINFHEGFKNRVKHPAFFLHDTSSSAIHLGFLG